MEGDNAIKVIGKAMDDVLEVGNEGIVCRYGGDMKSLACLTPTTSTILPASI